MSIVPLNVLVTGFAFPIYHNQFPNPGQLLNDNAHTDRASKISLPTAIKYYVINRCLAGLIHILGLFAPTCKAKKISINAHLFIRAGSAADFGFFFRQARQAENDGSFNSTANYNARLVKEGYCRQFLMTVKITIFLNSD